MEPDEKYLIIPSFSPENKPLGYKSAITANAAMDIAAAVDSLNMYKNILSDIKPNGYQKTLEKSEKKALKFAIFLSAMLHYIRK